ncbi:MAG: hypothetical protein KDE58_38915 [Caldilineaceae bacterium]|nr:hypothetical protein [Caldilineaceae bacterium]
MLPDSPIWIIVGLAAAGSLIYGLYLMKRNSRPQAKCIHCGATELQEIRREPIGSRTVQPSGGGTPAGGDIRLQLDYKVTYHCNRCHKESTFTLPKTY